jgi:hypothetical protein
MTTARVYRPHHIRQRLNLNGHLYGCTDSSTAMFADAVTVGGTRISELGVRKMSSEPTPDPASPGLNIPQAIAVLFKLRIAATDKTGEDFDHLRAYLRQERRVILQLDMYYLNDGCGGRNHVGHALLLQAERRIDGKTMILGNNPMCTGAKWYPFATLQRAADAFADQTGLGGNAIRFAISHPVPRIAV